MSVVFRKSLQKHLAALHARLQAVDATAVKEEASTIRKLAGSLTDARRRDGLLRYADKLEKKATDEKPDAELGELYKILEKANAIVKTRSEYTKSNRGRPKKK